MEKFLDNEEEHSPRIDLVSCGGTHTCFLATNGDVYTCGRGEWGRLGLGDTQPRLTPTRVDLNSAEFDGYTAQAVKKKFLFI